MSLWIMEGADSRHIIDMCHSIVNFKFYKDPMCLSSGSISSWVEDIIKGLYDLALYFLWKEHSDSYIP